MTTFNRQSLLAALKLVEAPIKGASRNGMGYVYLCAKNGFASVESANDTLRCQATAHVETSTSDMDDSMAVLANAAYLTAAANNAPGETVDISIGNRLTVVSGRFKAEVPILHTSDWFARQKRAITARFECAGGRLGAALKLCAPAASTEVGREQLWCVEFAVNGQTLSITATNGRCIAIDEFECTAKTDCAFKVPTEVAVEIGRRAYDSATVVVAVSQEPASALFSFADGSTMETALVTEGVDFRKNWGVQLKNQGEPMCTAKVDRKRLGAALSYGCDIAGDSTAVTVEITPEGFIRVSSIGKDGSFVDEIDCFGTVNSGSIRINGGMVEKLIRNFADESIDVAIHERGESALFSFGVQRVLVMGMRTV